MKIELIQGDITKTQADAIVNAANSSLLGGGGVDGAIHRAGGDEIMEDCLKIREKQGKCKVGEAVITRAGKLPAKYVIHTVGPIWNGKEKEEGLLYNAYKNSLALAEQNEVRTIAFPNISTGVYHFPKDKAAEIAIKAIASIPDDSKIENVIFVCFDDENYQIYQKLLSDKKLI